MKNRFPNALLSDLTENDNSDAVRVRREMEIQLAP
jgi:hypothetical protein